MRAVIICGGAIIDYNYLKSQIKSDDFIICADSGYDHAVKMGIKVDIVIGDFDSISQIPENVKTIRFPARKNHTDSEIALEYARENGIKDFLIVAASGNRLDHTLTNIHLLKDCLLTGENAVFLDDCNKIMVTNSIIQLKEPVGTTVSLIPLTIECRGVTTKNMEYPLSDAVLYMGKGVGVSNLTTEVNSAVSIREGLLLVIIVRKS